jgi:hypothetical protein
MHTKTENTPIISNDYLDIVTINKSAQELRLKEVIQEKGLPEDSTWSDICKHNDALQRRELIKQFELPENATWKDISNYYMDKERLDAALKNGLPETASWSDINNARHRFNP